MRQIVSDSSSSLIAFSRLLTGKDVPVVSKEALLDVLGERGGRVTVDGNVVVVVDADQVAELEVASERSSLGRDTLLQATITQECVGVVREEREAVLVEDSSGVGLCNGETD